jgi:hypothetical protein
MANPEHLEILKQGVEVWNEWRGENPEVLPDLRGADLSRADLKGAYLDESDLSTAKLYGADLGAASLVGADLSITNLLGANLRDADLRGADLIRAYFRDAEVGGADFSNSSMYGTVFIDTALGDAKGLADVIHVGPSELSISTIYRSGGKISEAFLRGCGVPEDFITHARSLNEEAARFYSCFISYSSEDQEFVEGLHADLQERGVRVWFAPHDLPIGARIRPAIDESIRLHDKLLLVLSETSVSSQWVEQEVETALGRERDEKRMVLFPIRLDEAVKKVEAGWPALVRNTRNIGDFRKWKNHDSYQKAFDRLIRDLKAEDKKL